MSRCNTQTKSRTRPKPAIWLQLRHKLNKTNLKIKFAKAQRGYRTAEKRSTKLILLAFIWTLGMHNSKETKKHMRIPHGQPEI